MRHLAAAALLLASTSLAGAAELNLYNWGNYTSAELLAKFEKETGIKVTVTDYDSNDTALAKIEAGATASTSWCPRPTMWASSATRAF